MPHTATRHSQRRIRRFFQGVGLDVICLKKRRDYVVYWADDREPLARLRPSGWGDEVEVDYWDDDQWKSAFDPGAVRPLQESFEFIMEDPHGQFFAPDETDDVEVGNLPPGYGEGLAELRGVLLFCTMAGAATGGLFTGAGAGGGWGALVGVIVCMVMRRGAGFGHSIMQYGAFLACVTGLLAGAVGALGGSINGVVAHGVWGPICGLLSGVLLSIPIWCGRRMTRGVAFAAGLTLAAAFVETIGLRDHFIGLALVAIAACASAQIGAQLMRMFWLED